MKKIILLTLATIFMWTGVAVADVTDHPGYARLETLTNSIVSAVTAKQDDFFIANGYYFQGVKIPEEQLDGEIDGTADTTKKPHDQTESWFDFDRNLFKKNLKIPYQISIDVYESPDGWGWILTGEFWYPGLGPDAYGNDGDHWVYHHHHGPEQSLGIFNEWIILPDF